MRKYQLIHHSPSPFFLSDPTTTISSSLFPSPSLLFDFDDVTFPRFPSPLTADLIHFESLTPPSFTRVITRSNPSDLYLHALCDRVSSLESKFDRLLELKEEERRKKKINEVDRKYTWTAEIKGGGRVDRKYKWTAEIEGDDEKKGKKGERKYQWLTEFKGQDDEKRTYSWKATIGGDNNKDNKNKDEKKKKKKKDECGTRIVEIEEPSDHGAVILRQAFTKRAVAAKDKGKKKDLSPQDAAYTIQVTFRAYLIRRSKALRALRDLAVAKTKLKELRALFHNFAYRSRVARDAEERQKFSEKIIVLLLTVDAIEGVDLMVRSAKRSMVDELEAMLDVVDPQPVKKSLSMRRRTFDMPSGDIQKEIAEGVAQVVQMIEEDSGAFEACV